MIIGVIGLGTGGFGTVDILTKEKERQEKIKAKLQEQKNREKQ